MGEGLKPKKRVKCVKDKWCRKTDLTVLQEYKKKKKKKTDSSIEKCMHYGAWYATLKEKKHAAHCHPAPDPIQQPSTQAKHCSFISQAVSIRITVW